MRCTLLNSIAAAFLLTTGSCTDPSTQSLNKKQDDTLYSGANFNDHIRSTSARTPGDEQAGFQLPEGFDIQLFASEPDIGKPINFNFDAQGRMWVTQSFEYPFPATAGQGKDRLTILEDTDGDGRADRFTHVTDTLNIPIGILPVDKGAVVYSIPNVLRIRNQGNTNDTSKNSSVLLGPFEHKDTHGMVNNLTRGFDGWIHGCHGYTNRSTVSGSDGHQVKLISGSTFRFREDGSATERETTGRINPFGLAYDELGYLYSTDCHTSPLYQLIRGADYPQSDKDEGIGFAPDMKPFDNEATALAGLAYYGDTCFPAAYRGNLYIGDAVSSRVYRNSFVFNGSSPLGKKEADFIKSSDPWFRPVAVQMGPDGALYIADFYNSIIGHYEVPLNHPKRDKIRGRIWRVTYKGKTSKTINGETAGVDALINVLKGSNLAARMQAADQLFARGSAAGLAPLLAAMKVNSGTLPVHALWILQRWGKLDMQVLQAALGSPDIAIRVHALRALREERKAGPAIEQLAVQSLTNGNAHVRRAGVELLGRFPSLATVIRVTQLLDSTIATDTHLKYTARLTLCEMLHTPNVLAAAALHPWSPTQAKWLAGIMIGVEGPSSGLFTLRYLQRNPDTKETGRLLRHSLRWVPAALIDSVVVLGRQQAASDPGSEVKVYSDLLHGFEERGISGSVSFQN